MSNVLRPQVLSLYRQMLRNASQFQNYSYRSYALRRIRDEFHTNKALEINSQAQQEAIAFAKDQAALIHRQMIISKLYPPQTKSIMEKA